MAAGTRRAAAGASFLTTTQGQTRDALNPNSFSEESNLLETVSVLRSKEALLAESKSRAKRCVLPISRKGLLAKASPIQPPFPQIF